MFSQEPHCTYRKSPLADVICQLRYPEILMIAAQSPAAFQEAIRHTFPKYDLSKVPQPGQQEPIVNHRFASLDGKWQVNLTSKFLSLTCSEYHNWEEFAKMLDLPLAAFIKTYAPSCFERVGLRYLNFVSRRDLDLEGVPFRELFQPHPLLRGCGTESPRRLQGKNPRRSRPCPPERSAGPGDQVRVRPGPVHVRQRAGAVQRRCPPYPPCPVLPHFPWCSHGPAPRGHGANR